MADALAILALVTLTALSTPKRGWRSLVARLCAAARGERRHVFGPPPGVGLLPEPFLVRWLVFARREVPRAIELGIPMHLIALLAEHRGTRRRRAQALAWVNSPAGLFFQHLTGSMPESDLHAALRARGAPLPAAKLRWTPPDRMTMPPMSWRAEWESRLAELAGAKDAGREPPPDQVHAELPQPRPENAPAAELEIRTLGEIVLLAGGQDFAPGLLHRPALAVTWFYLLARQAHRRGDRLMRGVFADELFPGLSPDQQRRKARQRLADLSRELPEQLLRIAVDREYVSLDLAGCDLDVHRALAVAALARTLDADDLLSPACHEEVRWALDVTGQEFLPGWEEIERRGTDRGSAMGQVVAAVRHQVTAAHLTMLESLADAHMVQRRPAEAVRYLEKALNSRPDRGDLATKLVGACEKSGLGRRADEVRATYGLDGPPTTSA